MQEIRLEAAETRLEFSTEDSSHTSLSLPQLLNDSDYSLTPCFSPSLSYVRTLGQYSPPSAGLHFLEQDQDLV